MPYERSPRGPKKTGFGGPRKPGGERSGYGAKPAGERKPYGERKSYGPRAEGAERRPYASRGEGAPSDRPRRAYGDKPAGDRPYGERKTYGERKSYGPRAEGSERRPYAPRGEGAPSDRPRRAYGDKPAFGERKPYGERKSYGPRAEGAERRPYTPRAPRTEGGDRYERTERPARVQEWGDARKPKFAEKTTGKAVFERKKTREDDAVLANGDGWLVGHHAVLAALKNGRRKVREVWLLAEATAELAQVLGAHPEWPVLVKAREDFTREFGEAVHQGVAALVGNLHQPSLPELLAQKPDLLVALDQVTDPHNLGAIVRSCAAFGVGGVLVTEHRAAGVNATAAKAAAGALESVPVAEITNLVQALKMLDEAGYVSVGLAGEAEAELGEVLQGIKKGQKLCLVVGSEGEGLRRLTRENCQHLAKIAIASAVESLNVSVATGVALALVNRR